MATWFISLHFDPINFIRYDIYLIFDYILVQCFVILLCIYRLFILIITAKNMTIEWNENSFLETLWTIYPTIIIFFIIVPSVYTLYKITYEIPCVFSIKIIGHQWYWTYDYSSLVDSTFDRYTIPRDIIEIGEVRLIDVDNRLIVPFNTDIQFLITSYDVIHSFSLPRVAVKVDCNPGYLNINKLKFITPGVYYALCREICGSAHRQISICCEVTSMKLFKLWLRNLY